MAYLYDATDYFSLDEYRKYGYDMDVYDENKFDAYVNSAVQLMHVVTRDYFLHNDFLAAHELITDRVKRAIGAQVEHYFYLGTNNATQQAVEQSKQAQSVSIGRTTVNYGGTNGQRQQREVIPTASELVPLALHYLTFTGLLYRGVNNV